MDSTKVKSEHNNIAVRSVGAPQRPVSHFPYKYNQMSLQSLCTTHRRQSPKREGQPVQGGNLLPRRLAQPGLMHAVGIDPVPKTCGQQKGQSQGEAEPLGKHQPGPLIP